ncbi:hypothetical protein [Paractinoplanes rishiriensis]|uniref:Uncharacterized protein n=1 Tax=Paractinoplanes rishiriensis TaxID=1050105 RepID=A0A919JYR2_9ACTN|nr:hypothetical protein [Actinoplanes rishiriensis]GIE95538.1 hypothetical protein Ari01nite_30030 [Actinoplanes rishiriensis]
MQKLILLVLVASAPTSTTVDPASASGPSIGSRRCSNPVTGPDSTTLPSCMTSRSRRRGNEVIAPHHRDGPGVRPLQHPQVDAVHRNHGPTGLAEPVDLHHEEPFVTRTPAGPV